jgi:hypothetical protein
MNFGKIFSALNTVLITAIASLVNGACWATVITGLVRFLVHPNDDYVMYWLWLPTAIAITIWGIVVLPKHLRKVGWIS